MIENYLITGGLGFIGSHFVKAIIQKLKLNGNLSKIIILDAFTYASDLGRLSNCDASAYTLIRGNVQDAACVRSILEVYEITHVVHFAAETHVDKSLESPNIFLETNVLGTFNLINEVSKYWNSTPEKYQNKIFLHISTDEVYGSIDINESPVDEKGVLNPGNPYAASKAAADQIVISMMNGFNFPAIITRSSNNFGQGQNREKLIPKMLECLKNNSLIPIYGEGLQMRCWLEVEVHCKILLRLLEKKPVGEIFNIRGREHYTNRALALKLITIYEALSPNKALGIKFVSDRSAHDQFYNICSEKLYKEIEGIEDLMASQSLEQFFVSSILNTNF